MVFAGVQRWVLVLALLAQGGPLCAAPSTTEDHFIPDPIGPTQPESLKNPGRTRHEILVDALGEAELPTETLRVLESTFKQMPKLDLPKFNEVLNRVQSSKMLSPKQAEI